MCTAIHLALKEIWRNRARFTLFSLVVALITVLVLYISALGTGLLGGFREYLQRLNADLIVYQDTARRVVASSRVGCTTRAAIRRVEGVREVGPIGFSSVSIVADDGTELLDISLIGVEPGKPGELPVTAGNGLMRSSAYEAIIDRNVARVIALQPGDRLTISSIQGNDKEFYTLQVVGVSDSLRYSLNPSVFVPIVTWDEIRPKAVAVPGAEGRISSDEPACNVVAVQLEDPTQLEAMQQLLQARVSDVEAVDLRAAYESLPGYSSIRSSLATQRTFALLIGMLVIGGFFQIQTLQKVPQIGTLKAIGTPNTVVALAAIVQIVMVTLLGIAIGSVASWGLSLMLPPNVPILFELRSGAIAVASIVLMGLVGGLVSVRQSLRVEPLIALGLGS